MQRPRGLKRVNQPAVPPDSRFTSYSLHFEDVILRRLFDGKSAGFFVDVGAGHPYLGNDTMALYADGWSGINVEPSPCFHKLLCERRGRDQNLDVIIGEQPGSATLYEIVGAGIATCVRASAEKARQEGYEIVESDVPVRTLEDILRSPARPSAIDLIKIAAEGREAQVLRGNNWELCRPRVIVLRADLTELGEDSSGTRQFLKDRDYACAYFDGVNEFYVEKDFPVPTGAFSVPRNVLTGYVEPCRVVQLEQSLRSARLDIADLHADRYRLTAAVERMRGELVSAADELEQAHKDREALIKYRNCRPLVLIRTFALNFVLFATRAARYVVRLIKKTLRPSEA